MYVGSICIHVVSAISTNESSGVKRRAVQYTSPVFVASQCKLVYQRCHVGWCHSGGTLLKQTNKVGLMLINLWYIILMMNHITNLANVKEQLSNILNF